MKRIEKMIDEGYKISVEIQKVAGRGIAGQITNVKDDENFELNPFKDQMIQQLKDMIEILEAQDFGHLENAGTPGAIAESDKEARKASYYDEDWNEEECQADFDAEQEVKYGNYFEDSGIMDMDEDVFEEMLDHIQESMIQESLYARRN